MADQPPIRAQLETGKKGGPWGFLIMVILLHAFDVFVRYGTLPFSVDVGPVHVAGSPWVWIGFFLLYGLVFLDASHIQAFKEISPKGLLLASIIAYLWGPFWSILPGFFPALKHIAALLLLIAPFWVIMLFYATQEFPKLSLIYSIIWLFLITFALFPNIKEFAEQQGHPLPNSLNPGTVIKYSWQKIKETVHNTVQLLFVQAPKKITEEIKRSIEMAKGDYYTGRVDQAAQKRLGVYLENFRAAEPVFYENTPVTAYVTMKAETLDKPIDLTISCTADENVGATKILPQSAFNIISAEQYDIDCIWNKGVLKKGSHNLNLRAEFGFVTRGYLKTYMMDRERLREYRRQNVDPLADVPDRQPVAIYTAGPVRIGMGVGQTQPVAVGKTGEPLQTWGITIENSWEGKILELTKVFFFIPEGLTIEKPEDIGMTATSCTDSDLPAEEQAACDDSLVEVYKFTADELAKEIYKNLTVKNIRAYITVKNPEQVLGKAPVAVQNFKVSVYYKYVLERSTTVTVSEVGAT